MRGKDIIFGKGGDDLICGGAGDDDAVGGAGQDLIYGKKGNDVQLFGKQGNDRIHGGSGNDGIDGQQGDDILWGGSGTDRLDFSVPDDTPGDNHGQECSGHGVDVSLAGGTVTGDGQDRIMNRSFEQVIGSMCDDVISGTPGNDTLIGLSGADQLYGRGGSDALVPYSTYSGRPIVEGRDGHDFVSGGAGADTVDYSGAMGVPGDDPAVDVNLATGMVRRDGTGHSDRLLGIEAVYGSFADDRLVGNADANLLVGRGRAIPTLPSDRRKSPPPVLGDGADVIEGAGGNDYLDGVIGDDVLDGGPGAADIVDYGHYGAPVHDMRPVRVDVNLPEERAKVVWPVPPPSGPLTDTDTVRNIEVVAGTHGQDRLRGDRHANDLLGEGGDDRWIAGSGGNDLLSGGRGSEKLLGGPGNDWCFGGKARGCEKSLDPEHKNVDPCAATTHHYRHVRSRSADRRLNDLRHLDQVRCFRKTGFGELEKLNAALHEMRVHRSPGG
jgi:Ca2+-binding RTX toxin-like protein